MWLPSWPRPEPPVLVPTFEEKVKHALVPGRLYIRYRAQKEWWCGEAEIRILSSLISRQRDAIDAGANKGTYTYFMARLARHVYAFEPNPKLFNLLRSTIGRNVSAFPLALSNNTGSEILRIPFGEKGFSNQGSSLSGAKPMANFVSLRVETRRIDDLGLSDIGFIKIDVEGYEREVISGAALTIARDRPNLLVEIEQAHSGLPLGQSIEWICGFGYDAFFLESGRLLPVHALDSALHRYVFNFIFLPKR